MVPGEKGSVGTGDFLWGVRQRVRVRLWRAVWFFIPSPVSLSLAGSFPSSCSHLKKGSRVFKMKSHWDAVSDSIFVARDLDSFIQIREERNE